MGHPERPRSFLSLLSNESALPRLGLGTKFAITKTLDFRRRLKQSRLDGWERDRHDVRNDGMTTAELRTVRMAVGAVCLVAAAVPTFRDEATSLFSDISPAVATDFVSDTTQGLTRGLHALVNPNLKTN